MNDIISDGEVFAQAAPMVNKVADKVGIARGSGKDPAALLREIELADPKARGLLGMLFSSLRHWYTMKRELAASGMKGIMPNEKTEKLEMLEAMYRNAEQDLALYLREPRIS